MIKNKITLNVLADISKKMKNGGTFAPSNNILILFNGSNVKLGNRLEELKNLQKENLGISLGFSFMGEGILRRSTIIDQLNPSLVYGEEDIFQLEKILEENSKLIMPNLTINTLSKVVNGMIDSFSSTILWTYLYEEKDVFLDFNSVRSYLGRETKNKAIKELLEGHIGKIKDMGAREIVEGNYIREIVGKEALVNKKANIDLPREESLVELDSGKRVLTEGDLKDIARESSLSLPKGTLITPLAKDRIKEKRIQIEIKE